MTVVDIVALLFLFSLFGNLLYTVYSSFNPQIVKIDEKYYVRKWSFIYWVYLGNDSTYWWMWDYANKWASHSTLEKCLDTLKRVKPPKAQKIKIN